MKRKLPTAAQKRWHSWLAVQGCYLTLGPAELHHCVGASGKHDKVWIGQDFVIPLSPAAHRGPCGIHADLSLFAGHGLGDKRKEIEKAIFSRLVALYHRQHDALPCSPEVLKAIKEYHR